MQLALYVAMSCAFSEKRMWLIFHRASTIAAASFSGAMTLPAAKDRDVEGCEFCEVMSPENYQLKKEF